MFRPTSSGFRRGSEDKPVFAAGIEAPAWKRHLANTGLVNDYKDQIADENRRAAQDQAQAERNRAAWKSGIGTVKRKLDDGTEEEYDANDLLDDPEVGPIAEESLFKRDIFETKGEIQRRSLLLQDPSKPKGLSDKEREDILLESSGLQETNPRHIELKKKLMDDEALKAEQSEHEKAIYDNKMRLLEMSQGGIQAWRERRKPAPTLEGAVANHQAVNARAAEFEKRAADLAAEEAELAKPVKGGELAATAPRRAEVALKREQLEADKAAFGQQREQSAATVAAQARQEADAMDGKPSGEAQARDIVAKFIGGNTKAQELAQETPGTASKIKGRLNEFNDLSAYLAEFLNKSQGDIDKAIEEANKNIKDDDANKAMMLRYSGMNPAGAVVPETAARFRRELPAQLAKLKDEMDAAGVDPKDRARIIQDAARANAWTENDSDRVRTLSTGELAINPGRVFGERDAIVAQINGTSASQAEKDLAVKKLDSMRAGMADKLANDLYYGDTRMFGIGEFRDFMAEKAEQGADGDTLALLDEWATKQKDRGAVFKFNDALWSGVAKGEIGIAKTITGAAAGVDSMAGGGQDLAATQAMLGDTIQSASEAEKIRGQTGAYAITSDLASTVSQMTPMFAGGKLAAGLNGISRPVVGGMSVYGWAAAQGYESKLSDAVDMAREAKGRDLTPEEMTTVLADGKTQQAAFLNGAQTAILSKVLGGGVERAALGKAASSMTVRDFVRRGGAQALRDGTLKTELKSMAKTIFADATDEGVEEFTNQLLDGAISTAALGKELKLGDLLANSFEAGAMGAVVGGAIPQIRRGEPRPAVAAQATPAPATPERVNAEILANDPDAAPATAEEVTAARDFVGEDPADAAQGVMINREVSAFETETAQGLADAEAQLLQAQASGDKGAVDAAEANVKKARGAAAVGARVRGALKIARAGDMSTLTDAEARSLGIKRKGDSFAPMTTKELEAEGLTRPLLDFGADDSPVILDEVLAEIRSISPAAAERVKLTETEARKAAQVRAETAKLPDQTFTVTGRNGTAVTVKAKTADEAQSLAVSTPSWPMGEQVSTTTTANEPNAKGKTAATPVPVPPVSTGTPGTANPVIDGSSPTGVGLAEAQGQGAVARDPSKPEQMTPQEYLAAYRQDRPNDTATDEQVLNRQIDHVSAAVRGSRASGEGRVPVSVEAVESLGVKLPEGYVRQGDLYVFQPPLASTPATSNTSTDGLSDQTTAGTPDSVGKAVLRRVTRLKKNPKLAAALVVSTDPAVRVKATDDGKISVNLQALAKEAERNGLKGKEAKTWITGVIDEEIRHLAQYEAAQEQWKAEGSPGTFKAWRNTHYKAIWEQEFVAKGMAEEIRNLYGATAFDVLQPWQKAMEGLRMVSQKIATGNPTEASKLLLNRSAAFIAHIRAALKALKEFVAGIDASPALKAEIAAMEAALATFQTPNEQNTANPRNRPEKQPSVPPTGGDVRGPEKDGDNQTSVDGATEPPRRDPAVSPAEGTLVGKRVRWVRRGESLSGEVTAINDKVVLVKLDALDAKGMGTAWAPVEELDIAESIIEAAEETTAPSGSPLPNERLFSDSYTGPRWTYGFRNRPLSIGTAPKGFIIGSEGPAQGRARHGTIQYPRELTKEEVYDFELEVMEAKDPAATTETPATATESDITKAANLYSAYHLARIAREAKNNPRRPEFYENQRADWTPEKQRDRAAEFLKVIDSKDVATLVRYNNGQFEGFWKLFGWRTGTKIPSSQRKKDEMIRDYVGAEAFAENEARIEADRKKLAEENAAKDEASRIQGLRIAAERMKIRHEGKNMNGREFADQMLAEGWRVENVSSGPVPRYQFVRGGQNITNSKGFGEITAYAREAQKNLPEITEAEESVSPEVEALFVTPATTAEQLRQLLEDGKPAQVGGTSGVTLAIEESRNGGWVLKMTRDGSTVTTGRPYPPGAGWSKGEAIDAAVKESGFSRQQGIEGAKPSRPFSVDDIEKRVYAREGSGWPQGTSGKIISTPDWIDGKWVMRIRPDNGGQITVTASEFQLEKPSAPVNQPDNTPAPLKTLRDNVTGAIERGEAEATVEQPAKPALTPGVSALVMEEGETWVFDKNGYVSKPGFNGKWTPEETAAMRERFKSAGLNTSTMKASGRVDDRLVGRFRIYDAGRETLVKELEKALWQRDHDAAAAKKQATQDAETAKNAQLLADADQSALTWINETFGEDFANPYNKAGLADYLSGKVKKFDLYRVNRKWLPGLEKLGAVQGESVDMEVVRKAFLESGAAPSSAAKPALTPGEQALKDAFKGMVDGLEAGELSPSYTQGVPPEKIGQFVGAAQTLIAEGVTTPEGLATALDKISPALRRYSDAVWSAFRMVDPSLVATPDWAGVYRGIDNTSKNAEDTTDERPQPETGDRSPQAGAGLEQGTEESAMDSESSGETSGAGTSEQLSEDGGSTGEGGDSGTVRGNTPRPGSGSKTGKRTGGNDSKRGGKPSEDGTDSVNPGDGSGVAGGEQPTHSPGRAGYRLTDPERIIGTGGPKARFARNRLALETFDTVLSEQRDPTPEEQDIIAAYIGWGSFGQELFQGTWDRPNPQPAFEKESEWLREHLGKAGWESIRDSIINAHYTDPPHVEALWRIVQHLGFKGGRVLEPSMGIGSFFGMMPDVLRAKSSLTGIELDRVVGGMAQMLYPDANIRIMGYEKSATADGFYDLVIGNWPFAKDGPSDPRYNNYGLSLHDYFFVKALDQVRPGGLVIGITSSGTMDKKGQTARRQMAKRAELVGAFRLPTGAFEKYAGTKVVTDIVILKKRATPLASVEGESWINTQQFGSGNQTFNANEYWAKNPDRVLGDMRFGHGTTQGRAGMVVDRLDNYADVLARIEQSLPKDILEEQAPREEAKTFQNREESAEQNSVVWNKGDASTPAGFYIVRGEQLEPLDSVFKWELKENSKTEKRRNELKQLLNIRQSVQQLLAAQRDGTGNADAIRNQAKAQYDAFVKEHGPIRKSFMVKALTKAGDPMALTLENLERAEGKKFVPRDILLKDIMRRPETDAKGSIEDAYAIHRNASTTLDLDAIAKLTDKPVEEVTARLVELNQIYQGPNGTWETGEEYLGGNVRRKLREAQDAKAQGLDMDRNIAALEAVQPKDVAYFEIEVQMGASWIPREDYLDYVSHLLRATPADFELTKALSGWNFKVKNSRVGDSTQATATWGTSRMSFAKVFQAAMNGTTLKVWDTDRDGLKTLNQKETELVNKKIEDIREELSNWLWSDPARTGRLVRDYNEVMNSEVVPKRNGSHLRLEGLTLNIGTSEFDFRQHQKDAVWRFIMDGKGLAAHEVGTGKTFTMAGLAVEGRRLGKFRKSIVFAHNANAESVYADFQLAYPGGKFLFIDNLSPGNRDNAMRQIATDEWDAVIVPHSLIDRFALREETLMEIANKQITQMESEIADALDDLGVSGVDINDETDVAKKLKFVKDSHTAKELVKARNRIIKRIKDKAAKAHNDKGVFFEDLGVDNIMVDEAHIFKKIALATRKEVKGLNKTESDRGWMLGALTDMVKSRNNGKGVFLFTGTPLTNNLNEAYNMMRFVMDDTMEDVGINGFDDWFNAFAAAVTDVELTTGGTFEPVSRLLSFVNVPELARLAGRFFDVVQAKSMPEFLPRKTPEGRTVNAVGRPFKTIRPVTGEMSAAQKEHKRSIQERYEAFQRLEGKAKRQAMLNGVDTPIQLETEGVKAALDYRLVNPSAPDYEGSKVNLMMQNAMAHYFEDETATQMIFMERGFNDFTDAQVGIKDEDGKTRRTDEGKKMTQKVRRPQFNLVRDMVEKLVAQGVRPEEIAVFSNMSLDPIADRPNDVLRKVQRVTGKVSKEDLAVQMREGKIRFAIGSTQTMGTGVNAQTHMRAMHHLDAPWTPGEFEQRNGRGHRQGNQWNTVFEYRYFTEGSHDGRRWQVLLNKVKFISRFTDMLLDAGGSNLRVLTGDGADLGEEGSNVSDFEQSFSTAAGDPRILVRAKLRTDVEKLERKRDAHLQAIARAGRDIESLINRKEREGKMIAETEKVIATVTEAREKPFAVVIDGKTFTERKEADDYLAAYPSLTQKDDGKTIMDFHGIKVIHEWSSMRSLGDQSGFYAVVPIKGGNPVILRMGKLSIASLESNLRGQTRVMASMKESYDQIDASVASLEEMAEKPFTRDAELETKRNALQQIEVELNRAPDPAPAWLRNGAPVGSLVYLADGKSYDVAAHRWDANGWWILVEDKSGMRPIDYRKALDDSGHPMFEEVPFTPPDVREDDDDQTVEGRTITQKTLEEIVAKADDAVFGKSKNNAAMAGWLFKSERYRKRDGRLAALRKISAKLQAKWDAADELPISQQETLEKINKEIAQIEKAKYQESMRGQTTSLQAASLDREGQDRAPRADSPEWKAMSKEERMAYLGGQKSGLRAGELSANASPIDTNSPGGANIGDGAQPGNSAVTQLDKDYLEALEGEDLDFARELLDEAAEEIGFQRLKHGAQSEFDTFDQGLSVTGGVIGWFTDSERFAKAFAPTVLEFYVGGETLDLSETYKATTEEWAAHFSRLGVYGIEFSSELEAGEFAFHELLPSRADEKTDGGNLIERVLDAGFSLVKYKEIQGSFIYDGDFYAALSPESIKSAKTVLSDPSGNPILPSQRFNQSPPAASGDSLNAASLDPQSRIDRLMDTVGTPDPEIMEEVAEQQRVFKSLGKKVVGRPDLANPGRTEEERALFDQVDEARKWHATRETFGQWIEAANKRNTPENDADLIEKVLSNAAMADKAAETEGVDPAPAMTPEDTIHFRLMMERRFRETKGDRKKLAENAVLRNAYRSARAAIARSLASGRDIFKTPEERHREVLVNLITELPVKAMRQIDARKWSSPQARDQAVQEEIEKRLAAFEKQFKKLGITLEEITNKEVFLSLSQNAVLKNIVKNLATAEKMAVQMMQKGAGFDAIRRRTGLPEAKIEAIRAKVDQELRDKLYAKVKAGLKLEDLRDQLKGEGLNAADLNAATPLTEEQIQAELDRIISVGFGIPKEIAKTSGFKPRKVKEEPDDENDPQAGAKRVIRRWVDRLATSQSDTLAWKGKNGKLTPDAIAMEALIREHVKTGVEDFIDQAVALGATPEQARVLDGEAGTERARVEQIREARKAGKAPASEKKELTPEEIADRVASRWIDKLAASQSDTLAWKTPAKTNELEALIREHLKKPVADFIDKAVALGASPEQARVLDGEATTERARKEMIAQWRKDNPKPRKPKAPKKPHEVDWNRPEFSDGLESYVFEDKDRSAIMQKVIALRDIVGAAGRVNALPPGKERAKAEVLLGQIQERLKASGTTLEEVLTGGIPDHRFNIADSHHVAMLARTIQAMDSDLIDKSQEYAFASMLSGIQTNLVNLSGGIVNSTWQATGDRAFEALTNLFFKDPANATFGEVKYMLRAMGPMLSRAWSNAVATWGSETSMFEEDILNRPPDLEKMKEGVTGYRSASIEGTKGRIIRIPLRGLLAADNFVATARACVEVGAMAYRLAMMESRKPGNEGMKPGSPEFEAFVKKEVNIPGSMAWQLAAQKAYEGNFNNALPGQETPILGADNKFKKADISTPMDAVGAGIRVVSEKLNVKEGDKIQKKLMKVLARMLFFPFVRVPYNILKQGIDRSINPISLVEVGTLLASNLRYRNGKWTMNADGQKQRIIESIGKQLQGTMVVALLLALGEGDDDDLEKKLLVTGSRPYRDTKKGERELGYRTGLGPYEISYLGKDGKRYGFSYGRIEPVATIMGGTVDMMKNVKAAMSGRVTKTEALGNTLNAYVAQVNEKTMLRGAADLMGLIGNDKPLDRYTADRISTIMPNLIKQAVRESDGYFRETPSEFQDMVLYGIWPAGMNRPVRTDLYGAPQKKDGSALQRMVDFTDAGVTEPTKDSDRMLYNWIRQNPENKDVPIPQGPDKNWVDPLTKDRKPMTAGQRAKFGEIAGTRLRALTKGMPFNTDKPTEFDMKRFRDAIDKSRDDARKILYRNPTWRAMK